MEHLRFEDFNKTIAHMYKLLEPGGIFRFDVPDLTVWSQYLYDVIRNKPVPFEKQHILNTIWGWQRWPGDEHKSGWTSESVYEALKKGGFSNMTTGTEIINDFIRRGIERNRFRRPEDAHIYIKTVK
jgi:predicted SAM-dependent methyltransferase